MAEHGTPADLLVQKAESILSRKPGLSALRTANCPTPARCAEVFTVPSSGWTSRETSHFRACPYCYEVGLAFSKASRGIAPLPSQRASSPVSAISRLLRRIAPRRGN